MSGYNLVGLNQPASGGGGGVGAPTLAIIPADTVGSQVVSQLWGYSLRNEHASQASVVQIVDDAGDPLASINLVAGESVDVFYPFGRPTNGSITINRTGGTATGSVFVEE